MGAVNLAEVIPLVEQLNSEEQLRLVEHVARKLQQKSLSTPHLSWKDARGLGKEVWEGIDEERYINELRDKW
jgi:hypothetical protein